MRTAVAPLAAVLALAARGEHRPDPAANRRNLGALLAAGAVTLCLGHGGPVDASRVATSFGLPLR